MPKFGARAEIIEPIKKAHRPKITNCLVLNHFVSKLESGKTIPITNIYPVTNH